jgi:DNA-binding GntR family transcriptional regulator
VAASEQRRGLYLTYDRVIELERRMAASEARIDERIDELRRMFDALERRDVDRMRARLSVELEYLRSLTNPPQPPEEPRP